MSIIDQHTQFNVKAAVDAEPPGAPLSHSLRNSNQGCFSEDGLWRSMVSRSSVRQVLSLIAIFGVATLDPSHSSAAESQPGSGNTPARPVKSEVPVTDKARSFWSFQPVKRVDLPTVRNQSWGKTPIDQFILANLESAGMTPAPEAAKSDLVRRVYFDLTGLPPTPEEVQTFVNDTSRDAYERLVDRLLNSPHYGEKWGQHWLDVVRFAETEGFEYDRSLPDGWRFRDYVIASFNADKPYDQFVMEQLAGDEIDPDRREMQVAAGFHRLGPVRRNAGNQEVSASRNEILTERTDIIGTALLGFTIGCARCHDHKFDPIRQKDYYQIQAFLAATHEQNVPAGGPEEDAAWKARSAQANEEVKKLKESLVGLRGEEARQVREKLKEAQDQLPPPPGISTVKNSDTERTPIHVLKRGVWENKGELVGMRGVNVLLPEDAPELPPDAKNPKTALARWITDPNHPLTTRVMANRIWLYHFGQGLVKTPNDFGANGGRPSHPELLDYLATQLVEGGWRLKPLHRMILLSSTYRQASESAFVRPRDSSTSPEITAPSTLTNPATMDPENRLLWRFSRRRLEAEEIRDAMLAVSGKLNPKAGGPSVIVPVDQELVNLLYKTSQWAVTADKTEHDRRSIYLIAKRNLQLPFMTVFDQPALLTSCARRESSTHAPQALELLNGNTANDLAEAFAERLTHEAGSDPVRQIERAYWLAVGRAPTGREKQLAMDFLAKQPLKEFALALFNLNAFLYVN
jgi:hypothetical protein